MPRLGGSVIAENTDKHEQSNDVAATPPSL